MLTVEKEVSSLILQNRVQSLRTAMIPCNGFDHFVQDTLRCHFLLQQCLKDGWSQNGRQRPFIYFNNRRVSVVESVVHVVREALHARCHVR